MRRDRINTDVVESILAEPDYLEPSEFTRWNAWKKVPRGWCRVTFVDDGDRRVVITVTLKRRGPVQN